MSVDLFGVEVIEEPKKVAGQPHGYSAPPGTGPKNETCKTCKFFHRITYAKTYFKCGLLHKVWTHGPGTDIRANSPACRNWSMPDLAPMEQLDIARPKTAFHR